MGNIAASQHGMFALLVMAARTFVEGLQERLEREGLPGTRPVYGFVFMRLAPAGATGNELAEYLGITKQAASLMIDSLEEHEYVVRRPHPTDRRGKLIVLTTKAWECIRATEAASVAIEEQWAAIMGPEHLEQIRADLLKLVFTMHGGNLPALRPIW
jgi:DNA-binding MarR family transcriptional regulator